MPFNKGDFTQQGVAGDVTSLVRLNEKRTVKLTLSADDASDNCDISGSVIDELNGKTYPIGSGVSGNIEITENGENINVAPYATATVNVSGGGDNYLILPMTEVTWDGTGDGGQLLIDPDTSKVTDNEQVIIRLNVQGEEPLEILLFGTYDATAGPTMEDFSGITEGDPQVTVSLIHNTERPNDPWFLVVSVGGEPMGGTYQVGVCRDIPHEVA